MLLFGWLGLEKTYNLGWLSNPLLALGYLLMALRYYRTGLVVHVAAGCLALTAFYKQTLLISASGFEGRIVDYGWGFYFWLAAMGLACVCSFLNVLSTSITSFATPTPSASVQRK